jgi:hypothetical protein
MSNRPFNSNAHPLLPDRCYNAKMQLLSENLWRCPECGLLYGKNYHPLAQGILIGGKDPTEAER